MPGLSANSARIEYLVHTRWSVAIGNGKVKDIASFYKKRAFFLKIRFKSRKIYLRGIGFNLTKIRVDSEVKGEVVGNRDLPV